MVAAKDGLYLTHVQAGRVNLTLSHLPAFDPRHESSGLHWKRLRTLFVGSAPPGAQGAGYSSLVVDGSRLLCMWELGSSIGLMRIPL